MEKKGLVLCDTDVIIEFYKNNRRVVSNLLEIGQENLAVSTITCGELMYGAINKRELTQIKTDLEHLNVIQITSSTSERFIVLMHEYSLSHRLSVPDGLIAATALTEDISLYTHNLKDFRYIKGIKLFKEK